MFLFGHPTTTACLALWYCTCPQKKRPLNAPEWSCFDIIHSCRFQPRHKPITVWQRDSGYVASEILQRIAVVLSWDSVDGAVKITPKCATNIYVHDQAVVARSERLAGLPRWGGTRVRNIQQPAPKSDLEIRGWIDYMGQSWSILQAGRRICCLHLICYYFLAWLYFYNANYPPQRKQPMVRQMRIMPHNG